MHGVFDIHVHNSQQLGRSCGDEAYSGPKRLFRRLWPVEAHMEKGDALCAARLAQLEMIRAGTTCFADPGSYFSAETAQAVKESGMRGMIARTVFDMGQTTMGNLPKGFFEPTDEALVRADEMVAEYEGGLDGRLKAWFSDPRAGRDVGRPAAPSGSSSPRNAASASLVTPARFATRPSPRI